jgi:hypothetical protein
MEIDLGIRLGAYLLNLNKCFNNVKLMSKIVKDYRNISMKKQ